MQLLKGKPVADAIHEKLKTPHVTPKLAIIRIGESEDDIAYENSIIKKFNSMNALVEVTVLPTDVTQETFDETLNALNAHEILLFRPLPKHLTSPLIDTCTPQAVVEILDFYGIDLTGKKVTIVGRSPILGKPLAMLVLDKNATVTICHTKTVNLAAECRAADVLIACAGVPKLITADFVHSEQIVIDVGFPGDVDFEAVADKVKAITPVPGGVGPVTTSVLLKNTFENARKCPNCKKTDPQNREMCPDCGYPVKPIPIPNGGKIKFGGYDWFVLDKQDDKTLIVTEKVIEKRSYHSEECEITWETCDMRKYLNGEFYESFRASYRERIIEVMNENPDNPWYGTSGCNPTNDKIFLLSVDEVLKYFGDSGQIRTRYMYPSPWGDWCKDEFLPWIDDQYNVNRRAVDDDDVCFHYWLRSPGCNRNFVTNIMGFCGDGYDQGGINIAGNLSMDDDGHFLLDKTGAEAFCNPAGVRPAMWIKN